MEEVSINKDSKRGILWKKLSKGTMVSKWSSMTKEGVPPIKKTEVHPSPWQDINGMRLSFLASFMVSMMDDTGKIYFPQQTQIKVSKSSQRVATD